MLESTEKNTFDGQLVGLERELIESWHLNEMAPEIMKDARQMPLGMGKTYDIGWGSCMIARTPDRFIIDILTKQGREAIDHETHHLEN